MDTFDACIWYRNPLHLDISKMTILNNIRPLDAINLLFESEESVIVWKYHIWQNKKGEVLMKQSNIVVVLSYFDVKNKQ